MPFLFKLNPDTTEENAPVFNLRVWLLEQILRPRMNTSAGYAVLIAIALLVASYIGVGRWSAASQLLVLVVLGPLMIGSMLQIRVGIPFILMLSFLVPLFHRLDHSLPHSLLVDITIMALVFGVWVKQVFYRDWTFIKSPAVYAIAFWISFCIFQLVNPSLSSWLSWVYSVRSLAFYWLLVPVALFAFTKTRYVQSWLQFFLALAFLAGMYGLYQYVVGFQEFEWSWLYSHPSKFGSVITAKGYRFFSVLGTPGSLGMTLAVGGLLALIFGLQPDQSSIKRVMYLVVAVFMLLGILISGSRTAFVVVPVGYLVWLATTWRKDILLLGVGFAALWLAILFAPIDTLLIDRMQDTVQFDRLDVMTKERENQDFVQPYIQSHPLGNGIGSTGESGQIFSPHNLLSQFPPNSGYVQIAVEAGWLGLFFYFGVLSIMLWCSVRAIFRLRRDTSERILAAGLLGILLMLIIANYPQKALIDFPTNLVFPLIVGSIIQLGRIGPQAPKK